MVLSHLWPFQKRFCLFALSILKQILIPNVCVMDLCEICFLPLKEADQYVLWFAALHVLLLSLLAAHLRVADLRSFRQLHQCLGGCFLAEGSPKVLHLEDLAFFDLPYDLASWSYFE